MKAAQKELDLAWLRLREALSNLDTQPDPGPIRARTTRESLTRYLDGLTANAEGRRIRCAEHPSELAFNCGSCRGERDGQAPGERRHPDSYPPTPEAARVIDARILGEPEREHRI